MKLYKMRSLLCGLLTLSLLAGEAIAGTQGGPPAPSGGVRIGDFTKCGATVCNCTSGNITSTFCHEEEFEFEIGSEIITVTTGWKSTQCDQVTIPPGKCVSQCYNFVVLKFCGFFWDSYVTSQVGVTYYEFPIVCSPQWSGGDPTGQPRVEELGWPSQIQRAA